MKLTRETLPRPISACGHETRDVVTCGNCHNAWCEACDPAPAALCHTCHGRGYSTAPALSCGHAPAPTFYTAGSVVTVGNRPVTMTGDEILFPGYAVTPDGRKICPACADSEQAAEMSRTPIGGRFFAYLSSDGRNVTTWTGGVLGRVTRTTSNDRQTFVRVVDASGGHWAGIGPSESGTYVSLRRVKGSAA